MSLRKMLIICLCLVSNLGAFATAPETETKEEKTETVSLPLRQAFTNSVAPTISDIVLIDGPVTLALYSTLYAFGMLSNPLFLTAVDLGAQTGGYLFRKTCKQYAEGDIQKGLCGAVGGFLRNSAKYVILGKDNPFYILRGMYNNAMYDGLGANLDSCSLEFGSDVLCSSTIVAIEAGDGVVETLFESSLGFDDLMVNTNIGGFAGILVYASIKTLDAYLASPLQEAVKSLTQD